MDESSEKGNGSEGAKSPPAAPDPLGELRRLLFVAGGSPGHPDPGASRRPRDSRGGREPRSPGGDGPPGGQGRRSGAASSSRQWKRRSRPSVRRNPQVLVDALFPVMGPAIRKAIASALASMVESFSETLEHSFSVQGVKWRMEAWRTGKPLAEVILLRTLVYRVEQVFLIHRESGLLLQHVSATAAGVQDADMVSGMLTAIRDFVHDSFGGKEGDSLDTFQVGERSVWIEQGPHATLAAVIRGSAPRELRTVFTEAIERIHLEQADALQKLRGRRHALRAEPAASRSVSQGAAPAEGGTGAGGAPAASRPGPARRSRRPRRRSRTLGLLRRPPKSPVGDVPRAARLRAGRRRDRSRTARREVLRGGSSGSARRGPGRAARRIAASPAKTSRVTGSRTRP